MERKKKYNIEVEFRYYKSVAVEAENISEAMDEAEWEASKLFEEDLDKGLLGASDFDCEAQEP